MFQKEFYGISNLVRCGVKKYAFFVFTQPLLKFCKSMKVRKCLDIYVWFFFFTVKIYLFWHIISVFFSFCIEQKSLTGEDPRCVINRLAWVNLFIIH